MRQTIVLLALLLAACTVGGGDPGQVPAGGDAGAAGPDASSLPREDGGAPLSGDAGAPDSSAAPPDSVVRVHYPAGTHTLALRGSSAPLSWSAGAAFKQEPDDTWVYTLTSLTAPVELKPLLDDSTWSRGPNYRLAPGQTIDLYPHFLTQRGSTSLRWASFTSTVLPSTRGIRVYLPPSYAENTRAKFPVLYMHDGQNLFDPNTAFGQEWEVDETLDAAAEDGTVREVIVVGIDNDADRVNELTPSRDESAMAGGKADLYLRMIIEEVKPMVDASLRTIPGREQTGIMGASLGGLVSMHAAVTHADVFGLVGAMSPSTWWDNTVIIREVTAMPASPRPLRIYLDSGDSGPSSDDVTDTRALALQLRALGFVDGRSLDYLVQAGGQHSEYYWAKRLPGALGFLIGPRTP